MTDRRAHVLIVVTGEDHYPDGDPDDPGFPNPEYGDRDYDGHVRCITPDRCNGWIECQRELDHWRMIRNGEPSVAPHPEGDEHDDEELLLHGEWHTYHYGWGWTVKWPGCVVGGHEDVVDFVREIGHDHGPGVYLVDDDWDGDSMAALDVYACVWPKAPTCTACGSPIVDENGDVVTDTPVALLNTGDGCLPLALPPVTTCRSKACRENRDAHAMHRARQSGAVATAECPRVGCTRVAVYADGCDTHHVDLPDG